MLLFIILYKFSIITLLKREILHVIGVKYDINKSEIKMKIFKVNFALFFIILNNYFVNFGQAESVAKVRHKITWG